MDDFEIQFLNGNYARAIDRDAPHMTTAEANAVYEFAGYDAARALTTDDRVATWTITYDTDAAYAETARAYPVYNFYEDGIGVTTSNDDNSRHTLWVPHDEGEEYVIRPNREADISFDLNGVRFNGSAFSQIFTREELDEYNRLIRVSAMNDEEPDLEDEKGGSLDDFLDGFMQKDAT